MIGLNRHTGRTIDGADHLAQSIHDILTTPKGTSVMQRDYGSDLPRIIDQPLNAETMADAYMAVAEALDRWEPRIDLTQVQLVTSGPGFAELELTDVDGTVLNLPVTLELVQ